MRESLNINKQHINIENEAETQPAAPIAMPIETKETYDDDDKATAQMLLDILYIAVPKNNPIPMKLSTKINKLSKHSSRQCQSRKTKTFVYY